MNYRKIWESSYGKIPKDENGRTYEIHHIDGNRKNNLLDNLMCISIQEHYDIHYKQGDWKACYRIRTRMQTTFEEWKDLNKKLSESMLGKEAVAKGFIYQKNPCAYCNKMIGHIANLKKHEKSCKLNPNRVITKNEKISKAKQGTKHSEEVKQKIKMSAQGRLITEDHKNKLSLAMKGKSWSEARILSQKNKTKK